MVLIIILIICLSALALINLINLLLDWIKPRKGLKRNIYISDIVEIIVEIISALVVAYIYF